MITIFQNSKF